MTDANRMPDVTQAARDLQVTARIRRRDHRRAGGPNVVDLALEQRIGLIGLRNRVDAGAAAAPGGLG